MATSSTIAVQTGRNTYKAIYCHYDGYVDGVGKTLQENYADPEKVTALINLGAISSLGERVAPDAGEAHSWQHPVEDVTVAYHRDRGEDLEAVRAVNHKVPNPRRLDSECYLYVYGMDNTWRVLNRRNGRLQKLEFALRDSDH